MVGGGSAGTLMSDAYQSVVSPDDLMLEPTGPAKPSSFEEMVKLKPGTLFLDPEGNERVRPEILEIGKDQYADLPEGTRFVAQGDPTRTERVKPVYEGVGFTAQYLYDSALTAEGKKAALERSYPGQVKEGPDGFYIEDEGVYRKPGRGLGGALGEMAAATPPALGMAGGAVAGGLGGTAAAPGPGTAAGVVGGGVLGAMAGRQFNNVMLSLAGIHEGIGEQIESMGWEGAAVAGGEVAGQAIARIPGAARATRKAVGKAVDAGEEIAGGVRERLPQILESFGVTPQRARTFLGTDITRAEQARDVTEAARALGIERGIVAPTILAPESPFLHKVEDWDQIFRKQNVFGEAARDYYERQGKQLLGRPEIGVNALTPLTRAEQKVSSQRAGQLALTSAREEMAYADAHLENVWREARVAALRTEPGAQGAYQDSVKKLVAAQKEADEVARKFVDRAIGDINMETTAALKEIGTDETPGALWRKVAAQFQGYNTAIRTRAKILYDTADVAGGSSPMPGAGEKLGVQAQEFLDRVPEIVRNKYPADIRNIAKLAGREGDAAAGIEAIPPTDLTFKEMRQLRSWLRYGVDWNDLTPDMREGALKYFAKAVNGFIHDTKLPPQFKEAATLLDTADSFYKDKIPYLHDNIVKNVMKGVENGVPPNPEALADVLFDPKRLEAMRKARGIVGDGLWKYVQMADAKRLVANSRTVTPGEINGKRFADQVESMVRSGVMEAAYDKPFADKMLKAAQNVRKLEGAIPVHVEDGDTLSSLMRKSAEAAKSAEEFADKDPIKALAQEVKRIDKDYQEAVKLARQERRADPLRFLYEDSMSTLATRAANRILGDQDLIMAAAAKFGNESLEFKALRQVYTQRFLQRALGKTSTMFTELGGEKGMTEEIQSLMFPGVTRKMMLDLVKNMDFLLAGHGGDVGSSIAGASRVLNPWDNLPIAKPGDMGWLFHIPGVATVGRVILGKLYATLVDGVSHPNFIHWLTSEIAKGETERLAARQVLRQRLSLGGFMGAQVGAYVAEENK